MHEALYQNMIIEIKNHIHDEILWRIRGTLLSNDEILEDLQQSVKIADAEAQYTDFIGYLPEDYFVSNETFKPLLDMAKPDRLNKQPSSFEKYATQTIEKLNEELLEEQKTWGEKTDFDRLFLAVKELKAQGILFNYYDDMKGGVLQSKVEQLISAGDEIKAYFYVCDQGIEHSTQHLSNLRKRFISQVFKNDTVWPEEGISLSSRSCKGEFAHSPTMRTKDELAEHYRMATEIAKKLNKYGLRNTVSDDGLSIYIDTFDWKLRRGEGASAAQKEAEQDMMIY